MATSSKPRKTAAPSRKPAIRKTPIRKSVVRKKTAVAKAGAKPRSRPPSKPASTAGRIRPAAAQVAANPGTVAMDGDKPKKPKLVRDSFTIPKSEYLVLQELKQRAGKAGTAVKKSEILRAGIKALAAMNDAALAAALAAVPAIKTGRPAKD